MTAHFGSKKINQVYLGTQNTNCLTSVPKNVKLELTYGAWTQPIFSSNTNGSLTLSASHESQQAWYAFNGDKTTNDNCWWSNHGVTSTSNPCWIQLKSAIKLKLNQVVIRNEHNTPENFKTAYLQVSNDGSSWTNVVTISGTNTGGYETTVNFAVSDGYYYYRLYFTESYSTGGVSIQTITFSGTAQNRLTLKAGSKVYVPNGFESDGTTPKFDATVIPSDYVYNVDFGINHSSLLSFGLDGRAVGLIASSWYSGTTAPTSDQFMLWYDTDTNKIKWTSDNGTTWTEWPICLPVARITIGDDPNVITSIDQVFDWCGYIGSTAFVLPGVKGLIPNGFNADGTYKSIEFTTDRVLTTTRTWDVAASFVQRLFITNRGKEVFIQNYQVESNSMPTVNDFAVWYSPKENIQRWNGSSNTLTDISQWTIDSSIRYVGEIPSDGTSKITSLTPATVQPLRTGRKINYIFKGSQLLFGEKYLTFNVSDKIQSWVVPNGVKSLTVDCVASRGFNYSSQWYGGNGGRVQCDLKVTPGQVLYFTVGAIPTTNCYTASYNASDIRLGGTAYANRVIVAGGGGSGCFCNRSGNNGAIGGNGGGTTGATGGNNTKVIGGGGGTQSRGGASGYCTDTAGTTGLGKSEDGKLALGGNGKDYYRGVAFSGAGGAGYYGGGAGGGYEYFGSWTSGGGGGSSYTDSSLCSNVTHTQGFNSGAGYIKITLNFS